MAKFETVCLDYNGNEVEKKLEQSNNSRDLIRELFEMNSIRVLKEEKLKGFTRFFCKDLIRNKSFILNIFYSNFKFDIQRPDYININLGTNITSPYELWKNSDETTFTIILGIYVYDSNDKIEDAILVKCPIEELPGRNYASNPSIRIKLELIKNSILHSDSIWHNTDNIMFRGFRPSNFRKIINLENLKESITLSPNETIETNFPSKSGPAPRQGSYTVSEPNDKESVVYIARWGRTNLWKLGCTTNIKKRIKDFNQYIPVTEFPDQDIWKLYETHSFPSQKHAYEVEQKIFNDPEIKPFRTSGERLNGDLQDIKKIYIKHLI